MASFETNILFSLYTEYIKQDKLILHKTDVTFVGCQKENGTDRTLKTDMFNTKSVHIERISLPDSSEKNIV